MGGMRGGGGGGGVSQVRGQKLQDQWEGGLQYLVGKEGYQK